MRIVAAFALLHLLLSFAGFGIALTFLRRTRFVLLAPLIGSAVWPTWIVISQSVLGYVKAASFATSACVASLAIACIWSVVAILRDRKTIADMPWLRAMACQAVAMLAGLITIAPHVWHNDFGYFEFGNGEFLNYSQLAAYSMGLQHSTEPVAWAVGHQNLRDGVDFVNATVALLTGRHPVYIVQISAALMRASYLAAVCALAGGVSQFRFALIVTFTLALTSFDMLQFDVSFMGAALAASMFVLLASLVTSNDIPRGSWIIAYAALNLALLISYPEGMAVLKVVELIFLIERREVERINRYLLGNVLVIATNPLLVWSKVTYVFTTISSKEGWNFLGLSSHMQRIVGIEPVYLSRLALFEGDTSFFLAAAVTAGALVVTVYAASVMRICSLLAIPVIVMALHVAATIGLKPHLYPAIKVMMSWWWVFAIAFAITLDNKRFYPAALAFIIVFAIANAETKRRDLMVRLRLPTFAAEQATENTAKQLSGRGRVALLSDEKIPILFWLQVLDAHGIEVNKTERQQSLWKRLPSDASYTPPEGIPLKPASWLTFTHPATDLKLVQVD